MDSRGDVGFAARCCMDRPLGSEAHWDTRTAPAGVDSTIPFKATTDRHHHIPKQKRKVTNWATEHAREGAYHAGLRQRGSLTVWFSEEAIVAWRAEPRTTRGGQPRYSPLAILTALTLRAVSRIALRQTEGLIGSIINLLGLTLAVPDEATLRRRAKMLEAPGSHSDRDAGSKPMHLLVDRPN
jgi:hypothetical protein